MTQRRVACLGDPGAQRLAALEAQKIETTVLETPAAPDALTGVDAVLLEVNAANGQPESALARLEGAGLPVLAIFPKPRHGETPTRLRRTELLEAGASDAMLASADLGEFVTRVRALMLLRTVPRVLVVEDEAEIAAWAVRELGSGYIASRARSLGHARAVFASGPVDVLIIDRRLPDGDGLDFLREIRHQGIRTPAVLYTAMDGGADRVAGLEGGADDYLCKPIHAEELRARVAVLLRPALRDGTQHIGALEIAHGDGLARWKGCRLGLRQREYSLLAYLAAREGLRIPQKMLLEDIWERSHLDPEANPVTQTKYRLGRALRAAGVPDVIVTEEDCYRFDAGPLLTLGAGHRAGLQA